MIRLTAFFVLLFTLASHAFAEDIAASRQLEYTKATLVSKYTSIEPGKDIELAVILEPKKDWHTYWENPGDAGMPTELTWELPEGFKAGGIDWPAPDHLAEGPLLTYAYKSTVFLPVTVSAPSK